MAATRINACYRILDHEQSEGFYVDHLVMKLVGGDALRLGDQLLQTEP